MFAESGRKGCGKFMESEFVRCDCNKRSIFVRLVREGRNVRIQSGLKEEKEQDRGGDEADRVEKVCDTCGARDSR